MSTSTIPRVPGNIKSEPEGGSTLKKRNLRAFWGDCWIGYLEIVVLVAVTLLILRQNGFNNLFSTTTVTGGDTAGHLWGPDFIKEHLLPELSGWSHDWWGGFPAFTFYMVIPNLAAALLAFIINANVAFKLVTIVGLVAIPLGSFYIGKMSGLKRPIPIFLAVFSLIFIYDDNHTIWGGNVFATLAGEYSETWGLAFCLFYLGTLIRCLQTGRLRVWAGVLLALTVLSHPITGIMATIMTLGVLILHPKRGILNLAWIFGLGALLSSFWVIPLWFRREYITDIGWAKIDNYGELFFRGDFWWIMSLALVAAIVSFVYRIKIGKALSVVSLSLILLFRFFNTSVFLGNRLLPLYYISIILLAAMGLGLLIRSLFKYESKKLDKYQRLILGVISLMILCSSFVVIFLRYFIPGGFGPKLLKFFLRNEISESTTFLKQLVSLSWIGLSGLALALLVIFLTQNLKKLIGWAKEHRGSPHLCQKGKVRSSLFFGVSFLVILSIILAVSFQLRYFGFQDGGRYGWHIPVVKSLTTTKTKNASTGWANWNFTGYEGKAVIMQTGPGWEEFSAVVEQMKAIGKEHGCGRSLWEYQRSRQDTYGSNLSRNMLPYWTDGCITAIDGLYTESSATAPFYYITLTEVSTESSEIVVGLTYVDRRISKKELFDRGVKHLQQLGVRYYLAGTPETINFAKGHKELEQLAVVGIPSYKSGKYPDSVQPHSIYLVKNSDLVVSLENEPVVTGAKDWLKKSNEWWVDPSRTDVAILGKGPDTYQKISFTGGFPDAEPQTIPQESVKVTDLKIFDEEISFEVDKVGIPILVKVSYFPNWKVSGAKGPYRASPNWMVVIPTKNEVTLSYHWSSVEYLGYGMTATGIILCVGTYIYGRRKRKGIPIPFLEKLRNPWN